MSKPKPKMLVETLRGEVVTDSYFSEALVAFGKDAECCRLVVYSFVLVNTQHIGTELRCDNGHRVALEWGTSRMAKGKQAIWERRRAEESPREILGKSEITELAKPKTKMLVERAMPRPIEVGMTQWADPATLDDCCIMAMGMENAFSPYHDGKPTIMTWTRFTCPKGHVRLLDDDGKWVLS